MVKNTLKHILSVIWNWFKWTAIQSLVMVALMCFALLIIYILSLFSEQTFLEFFRTCMPRRGPYSWENAVIFFMPVYTFLFCVWKEIKGSGKLHWSMIVPQVVLMLLVYLEIAHHLDWNFRIITVDEYMLGGWLAPLYGAAVQLVMGRFKHGR